MNKIAQLAENYFLVRNLTYKGTKIESNGPKLETNIKYNSAMAYIV